MTSENLVGICEEPTTYRDEFRYRATQRQVKEICADKKVPDSTRKIPLFAESHDTLQKLSYPNRPPFDALWRSKEIVGTNPRTSFFKETPPKERTRVLRTKPIELASPAVNLDNVEDSKMRELLVDFTYRTTTSQSGKEVWRNLKKTDVQLPNTICEDSGKSVSLKLNLIPDLPAGFKGAAKRWDFLQDRNLVERDNLHRPAGENKNVLLRHPEDRTIDGESRIDEKKLSLPYKKLSSSYGGHRTPLALGVNLEKNKLSIYHPDLTVSQVLASRRCQDG